MHNERTGFTGLIVEDEWLLRMELIDEMQAAGWRVLEAGSGEAALALMARESAIDFLVTDVRLPGRADGWTVADAFRAAHPDGAVIYVSANPELTARRAPGSAFLGKPCDMAVLLATADRLVLRN